MTQSAHDLVITGSTGRLGGRVAHRLSTAGLGLRLLVRDPERAPALPQTDVIVAAYSDPDALDRALDGARTVFMVSAAETPDRVDQHRAFIDAAAAAGVQHVIYTSFFGAAADCTFTLGRDHWATEEHLRASGMGWTFLRDNLYLDFLPLIIGEDDVIRGPAADGRIAGVAIDDLADVATNVVRSAEKHAGMTYDLTGPEALSLADVAAILSRSTGRSIRYHDETVEEAYASRAPYGAPQWQLDAWVSTYTAAAAGELARVTTTVRELTGHEATSLEALLSA
jgi:NAD(P)H dehydrogenase (quinone)